MHSRTRSLACKNESTRASHHRQGRIIRRFLRNGFNGCFVLSLVNRAFLPPSRRDAKHHRQLTPASGRQDHTTSPSALPSLVS
jgi:hypothetical protein